MSQLKAVRQEEFHSTHRMVSLCFILSFNWLDENHPYWGWQSALLSLLIQILISFKNILTDTSRIFDEIAGHPVVQPSWHIKLTITSSLFLRWCKKHHLCGKQNKLLRQQASIGRWITIKSENDKLSWRGS